MPRKIPPEGQIQKFIDTARALGCDESEEAFTEKLKALMTVKPMKNEEVRRKAKKKK